MSKSNNKIVGCGDVKNFLVTNSNGKINGIINNNKINSTVMHKLLLELINSYNKSNADINNKFISKILRKKKKLTKNSFVIYAIYRHINLDLIKKLNKKCHLCVYEGIQLSVYYDNFEACAYFISIAKENVNKCVKSILLEMSREHTIIDSAYVDFSCFKMLNELLKNITVDNNIEIFKNVPLWLIAGISKERYPKTTELINSFINFEKLTLSSMCEMCNSQSKKAMLVQMINNDFKNVTRYRVLDKILDKIIKIRIYAGFVCYFKIGYELMVSILKKKWITSKKNYSHRFFEYLYEKKQYDMITQLREHNYCPSRRINNNFDHESKYALKNCKVYNDALIKSLVVRNKLKNNKKFIDVLFILF